MAGCRCTPITGHDFFTAAKAAYPLTLKQQQETGLGERMHHAFCSALAGYSHALLMGCDCPSLTGQDIEQALTALTQENDVVLAPAEDGGYVLIDLNKPCPELFDDMPWGTAQVIEQTRSRIRHSDLRHYELSEQWDLDTPEVLERYRTFSSTTKTANF
ncbi:MAG: TIGR04282 family arsenosugar biosynthesis glycosyltransferase [Methylobacter sp.]